MFAAPPESSRKRAFLLGLKVVGAACWTGAYYEAIREARKTGKSLIPDAAITCNLAWEFIYTAGGTWKWRDLDTEDKVQTAINSVWLSCDILLAKSLDGRGRKNNKLITPAAVLYQLFFLAKYPPGKAARISALWQNLAYSGYSALTPTPKFDNLV